MAVRNLLLAICLGLSSAAGVMAQCVSPGTQDFDSATPGTSSYGLANTGILPTGWTQGTGPNGWKVYGASTPSSNTGPTADHTGTGGNYLYTEASGGSSGEVTYLYAPCFDGTTLANPALSFWYHMHGSAMGTLEVEASTDGGTSWSPIFSLGGDQGPAWQFAHALLPLDAAGQALFRFKGTRGGSFTSDMAIDDVVVGEAPQVLYQPNSLEAGLDIDGVQCAPFQSPAVVHRTAYVTANPAPASMNLNFSSTLPGQAWEIAVSDQLVAPSTDLAQALPLPDGQVINLNTYAGTLRYLNGGSMMALVPLPAAGFQTWTMSFLVPADLAGQAVVTDPTAMLGMRLSQATELHVTVLNGGPPVAGPTADDSFVTIDFANSPPPGWGVAGIPFYGSVFSLMHVVSNGRVMFGASGDTAFSASATAAMGDNPFVGFWTDLNPSSGGSITMTNPAAGIVRVDYQGVPYYGETVAVGFGVQFDTMTGDISIDGLAGIPANPAAFPGSGDNQFLGLSPGNLLTATDPGAVTFSPAGAGQVGAASDMLYDFLQASAATGGLVPSLGSGLSSLTFFPDPTLTPNYAWAGQ